MRSPRRAGNVFSQLVKKSAATCRGHDQQKVKKSMNHLDFLKKSSFSSILAAEVLKKADLALPRSTGITKKTRSPPSTGITFQRFTILLARERYK